MKKHLFSAILVMLILLAHVPAASADTIYPAPGAVQAGQTIDHLAATVSAEAAVNAVSLPDGLRLEVEPRDDLADVYLRGAIAVAGVYDCIISIDSSSYSCPITVSPQAPAVSICPDIVCGLGDLIQLSVSVHALDDAVLQYQWYVASQPGAAGLPVDGGTEPTLPLVAEPVGTQYFYCQVISTVNGASSATVSSAAAVSVQEVAVSAIAIASPPTRTQYSVGERLDTAGLSLLVTMINGSTRELIQGFGVYPELLEQAGEQRIEVSYQGQTASFTVQVAEEELLGIGVLNPPTKTVYMQGDRFDVSGLSIRAYLADGGTRDISTGLTCSPMELKTAGMQTITVSYGGKTCTYTVQVMADTPQSLSVARLPDKLQYALGDTLDTSGLILRQVSSSNRSDEIRGGFTCTPTQLNTAGRQEITVRYGELSCTYNVTVAAPAPVSPSPSPEPESEPSAAPIRAPQPSPAVAVPATSHASGVRTLLVSIIVAALLAMAVLGVYVFIANHGGAEGAMQAVRRYLERFRRR